MRTTLILLATALTFTACTKETPKAEATKPAPQTLTFQKAPAVAPQQAPAAGGLHGKIAEKLDVPSYSYLRLETGSGSTWVAVPTSPLTVGTEVTVNNPMEMKNFESKALNRTFDVILFAQSATSGEATGSATAEPMPAPAAAPTPDLANVKTAKAEGPEARTVAELWAQKGDLKDKTVAVRGKVVKVTSGVMGKNWLHLRDGSGSDAAKDNDITVTSTDVASINDEVTVRGTVHLDRDLGSGYNYPVIVEDAKVAK